MGHRGAPRSATIDPMLALAVALALTANEAEVEAETEAVIERGCPYGSVQYTSSPATADYTVRFVTSQVRADCVVRWVTVAPGPGQWRKVASWPDFRVFVTSGIADFDVYAR